MNAQDDFCSLGIPEEARNEALLHFVDLLALPRKSSDKSMMMDLEFGGLSQESSPIEWDDALEELLTIASKKAEHGVLSDKHERHADPPVLSFENGHEPIRKTTAAAPLRPPRRFPRRIWIGLVKRMLRQSLVQSQLV